MNFQEGANVRPAYGALTDIMGDGSNQKEAFRLENQIITIDRHAQRRYQYVIGQTKVLKKEGINMFPSSPSTNPMMVELTAENRKLLAEAIKKAEGLEVPETLDAAEVKEMFKTFAAEVADPSKKTIE